MSNLDSLFRHAIRSHNQSNESRWITCRRCAQVVGGYDKGAVKDLASVLCRSTDSVYDMARAYRAFYYMWKEAKNIECGRALLRDARRKLGYSFFAVAGRAIESEEVSVTEAMAQIFIAWQEQAPLRFFAALFKEPPAPPPPPPGRRRKRIVRYGDVAPWLIGDETRIIILDDGEFLDLQEVELG